MPYTLTPIGTVQSPYTQKFGIPRQPQLVPAAQIIITLTPQFSADSVRGLDGFDYIWLQFLFHDAIDEGWAQMVRPPRLGGKQKMGVFATRSPHRPNHIGLSLLRLRQIDTTGKLVRIHCEGGDLLDGTPVIDIKPYIPFAEAHPEAHAGFVNGMPERLSVVWQPESHPEQLAPEHRALIEQSLAQDPRPAYQDIPERIYGATIAGKEIKFQIANGIVRILSCG
nr:tRNA (N6-threonylcarbamoyladenosine(37)-N6)-methyltransferase TrmO [uncultured Kingella sp.]